jgi:DNA recombination protein RmuC
MNDVILFFSGVLAGGLLVYLIMIRQWKTSRQVAEELVRLTREEKQQEIQQVFAQVRDAFGSLSMEALGRSTEEFLKLAGRAFNDQSKLHETQLQGKKELIDQTLQNMKTELSRVQEIIQKIEQERQQSFGALTNQLRQTADETRRLQNITGQLNAALSHSQVRGQWGERMAEDVLRLAGFMEGINYLKQNAVSGSANRPDFTFFLPHNLKVNMDVKFPLTNYLAYLQAPSESERLTLRSQFLKDVRRRVKEVTTRDYINPEDQTVDYVIIFIPNEQVYSFINEQDGSILDDALKNKVILCSPVTLYAILAVIRQAMDNFSLEKTAAQISKILQEFSKQWNLFRESMDKMGRRIDEAQREYQNLISTRANRLERPLQQIETLRQNLQLPENSEDKIE